MSNKRCAINVQRKATHFFIAFLIVFLLFGKKLEYFGTFLGPQSFERFLCIQLFRYVCLSVDDMAFSGLAHYFFLIFCMKLGFNKH